MNPHQDISHLKICSLQDFSLVKLHHQYLKFILNSQRFTSLIFVITHNSLNIMDKTNESFNISISHMITLKEFGNI